MGENDRRGHQPASGLLPNGLLPNEAASLIRPLDLDRWSKAEKRTAELIECFKPNKPSEDLRGAVASYVQQLIMNCFPCQVFTFGSVPLKTYLPDGDIDLTAFSNNENMKDTWAQLVRDMLESEEKNENAEFRVKEVQYIQAEVKIIKCLVENIVVDISFNQLGGLCTLCFLEEVDDLINQDHLFKRSIILIKAWCYYESRILGAHHGLISTYALETLVLYIFHVFNNSFAGPLEVLYRFLEFFSKFDWDNFCVSLWGPVPISSLPDVTAEPPRMDGGDLLLSKLFLETCSTMYAVHPTGQENQGQPFVSKHFNVIDPLRVNNNLGRSVSKGNFFRIRSAFAFGAKRLARLLDCPKEDICFEVNQFFMNTWERHGCGHCPDEPRSDLLHTRLSNHDSFHGSENLRNNSVIKPSLREAQGDTAHSSRAVPSQHANYSMESTSKSSDIASVSQTQNQKNYTSSNNTRTYDQTRRTVGSNHGVHMEKSQKSSKPDNLASDLVRYLFARTRSSPELTDDYAENSSQGRRDRASESGKGQGTSARLDVNGRKNLESDNLASQSNWSSTDDPLPVRQTSSHQSLDGIADSNTLSNSNHDDLGLGAVGEEFTSFLGAQGMHQEEQDLVNMMAASAGLGFSGQVHVPLNLAPGHIPLPFSPSVLASLGYLQRNLGGIVPANIPLMESPWGTNIQFPQGLISPQVAQYFPGVDLTRSSENSIEPGNENFGSADRSTGDGDHDFWQEQDRCSTGGFDLNNGGFEMHQSDDKQDPTSASFNLGQTSLLSGSVSTSKAQQQSTKETRASMWKDRIDSFLYQDDKETDTYVDDKIVGLRPVSLVHSSSIRSTTSESSREGSSKVSKSTREKRGRKTASSALPSPVYGKSRSVSEHSSNEVDDDNRDWSPSANMGQQLTESTIGHVARQQTPGFEPAQTSGSQSLIPFAPVILGPSSRQRSVDNSGTVPFAFYPTGPPVPFVTMLPVYNFPTETGTADALTSQFNGKDGLDASDSGQNFVSSDGLDQSEILSTSNLVRGATSAEPMEQKADILNSDFASHWQNLQYGRFCQNPRQPAPLIYQSPVMVPPVYLQGRFPLEAPGRPLSTNMNLFTQLMSYGPHVLPVAPLQSVSSRPTGVYKQYVDEMPRYRSGTGTYLPNPKASFRDRHTSARKGSYNYERNDYRGEREGNWNGSNSRTAGRSHNRSQAERSSLRMDRLAASENRADRPWSSHKHNTFPAYHSQNGPVHLSSTQSGANNVAYGMYPIPPMSPGGVSLNGPTVPPVVMFYRCDHNAAYASSAEQLEFGSLGPVGCSGLNEVSHLGVGSRPAGGFEGHRFHGSSAQQSSPDQPSSPHLER